MAARRPYFFTLKPDLAFFLKHRIGIATRNGAIGGHKEACVTSQQVSQRPMTGPYSASPRTVITLLIVTLTIAKADAKITLGKISELSDRLSFYQ